MLRGFRGTVDYLYISVEYFPIAKIASILKPSSFNYDILYSIKGDILTDHTEMIQRAIEYIEKNLKGDISLDKIADAAYCSPFHFHRLFKEFVGDTPGNYIRKRRLTEAAKELKTQTKSILEIAIEYGYNSQAAFTYSFKRYHMMPPGMIKKGRESLFDREKLSRDILVTYRRIEMTEPRIVSKEDKDLMGIVYYGDGKDKGIEEIYVNLKKNIVSVGNRKNPNQVYGVCFRDPDFTAKTGKFNYMVAVEVSSIGDIPLEMVAKKIPSHDYAVFKSKEASYDNIDQVVQELWSYAYEWVEKKKVKN